MFLTSVARNLFRDLYPTKYTSLCFGTKAKRGKTLLPVEEQDEFWRLLDKAYAHEQPRDKRFVARSDMTSKEQRKVFTLQKQVENSLHQMSNDEKANVKRTLSAAFLYEPATIGCCQPLDSIESIGDIFICIRCDKSFCRSHAAGHKAT